jgi:peroxiredoxin
MVFMQHLVGRRMPDVDLEATSGSPVNPSRIRHRRHLLLSLHRQARPSRSGELGSYSRRPRLHPAGAGLFPAYGHFRRLGVTLFGLSMLSPEWQRDFVSRNRLTFRLLSDHERAFQSSLGLPMFETGGELYLQRLTFILHDGIVSSVRFPVPEPEQDATEVLAAL